MKYIQSLFRLAFIASFALVFMVTACTPETVTPDPKGTTDIPEGNYGLNKQTVLDLVNATRATGCNCGTKTMPPVPALTWNNRLATAAFKHSQDMNDKNYFEHTSQDGRSFSTRITAEGYNWLSVGENIAKGYSTEQEVVQAWFNSPGHCENIMSSKFTEMGAGRVGEYWTQDFGKPE